MIDAHCHILPGVDDGARDEQTSLDMARRAAADGVTAIVATPHMREGDFVNEGPETLQRVSELNERLRAAGIAVEVYAGAEVHLAPQLVEQIQSGRLLTYNNRGVHLLLECPYRTRPVRLEETIFELKLAGVTPVLAHPERIQFFSGEPERYEEAVRLGAVGQLTTSSLLGEFGPRVQRLAEDLVRRGLVHVLASDAHDSAHRPPCLAAARTRWATLAGEASAEAATHWTPQALLDGAAVVAPPPLPPARAPRAWARLFRRR